jgi:hypothetical protein
MDLTFRVFNFTEKKKLIETIGKRVKVAVEDYAVYCIEVKVDELIGGEIREWIFGYSDHLTDNLSDLKRLEVTSRILEELCVTMR